MEQSNALLQNLLGNTMGTADQPSSFLGQFGGGLYDLLGGAYGGIFGATSSMFDNYGPGGFGDAAVDADYEDFLRRLGEGGGVNLPATTVGGGGI